MPFRALRQSAASLALLAATAIPAAAQTPIAPLDPIRVRFWSGVPNGGGTAPGFNSTLANVFCEARLTRIDFASASAFAAFMRDNCPAFGAQSAAIQQGFSFGARFDGVITAFDPGSFTFRGRVDDGNRFWMNGTLYRDAWRDQLNDFQFTAPLARGTNTFQIDFYANSFGSTVFTMTMPTGTVFGVVPEPSALLLTGAGAATLALARRRRRA